MPQLLFHHSISKKEKKREKKDWFKRNFYKNSPQHKRTNLAPRLNECFTIQAILKNHSGLSFPQHNRLSQKHFCIDDKEHLTAADMPEKLSKFVEMLSNCPCGFCIFLDENVFNSSRAMISVSCKWDDDVWKEICILHQKRIDIFLAWSQTKATIPGINQLAFVRAQLHIHCG